MGKVDERWARELELYYENDYKLYQTEKEWIKLFRRKKKTGKYNHFKAIKGISNNFIPLVIKSYRKQFGRIPPISKETKKYMATRFVKHFEIENKLGNYD